MKKFILSISLMISALGVSAQSRKYVANFPLFQQYFNPALTGYEGSMLKTFYRNQWTGFDDAPRTLFASVELDPADISSPQRTDELASEENGRLAGAKQAWGLSVLHDSFGPFSESQVNLSYGTRVRLSDKLSLRAGAALTYTLERMNGNMLTIDQAEDSEFQGYLGQNNRSGKFDANLGLMLTSDDFYVGYSLQDIANGGLASDEAVIDDYALQHIVQAGYRRALSEEVGLALNGIYRYDSNLKETAEVQAKFIFQNMLWLGAGYRNDLAYTINGGVRLNRFRIGYVQELASGKADIRRNTSELMVTYNLVPISLQKLGKKVTMW